MARKTRLTLRQQRKARDARIEALKIVGMCFGFVTVGLPVTIMFGLILGDGIHHTNGTGAAIAAIVNLFA